LSTITWAKQSRRMVSEWTSPQGGRVNGAPRPEQGEGEPEGRSAPISRSTYGFCQGDLAAVSTSSMPRLRTQDRHDLLRRPRCAGAGCDIEVQNAPPIMRAAGRCCTTDEVDHVDISIARLSANSARFGRDEGQDASPKLAAGSALNPGRIDWATLLKRTYDFDVLSCPCGGRLRVVELVTEAGRAKGLLEQFGMSTKPPPIARARSPDWD
jgi:hypothetical protein